MLARHIHLFMSDEEEAGVFLSPPSVDPSRAPPTGDAQVTPVAGERRGRVRPPQVLHIHFHHLHHLRPRLHFTAFSPVDRRAPLVTAVPRTGAGGPGPATGPSPWRRALPGAPGSVSYRNNLVNSLMAQHTCLHSSALQEQTPPLPGQHTATPTARARPPASPGDLLVEVGQLFVGHGRGAS